MEGGSKLGVKSWSINFKTATVLFLIPEESYSQNIFQFNIKNVNEA